MQIEISEAGKKAETDLAELRSQEFGGRTEDHSVGATILKILTLMAGIFFSMVSATTLPPEMAFISITLIAVATLAILSGAEKIIAIFPRSLWIWKSSPSIHYYPEPAPIRTWWNWKPSWNWSPWRSASRIEGLPPVSTTTSSRSRGHPVSTTTPSSSWWSSPLSSKRSSREERTDRGDSPIAVGTQKVAKGGKHFNTPIARGTDGRVAPGGGHDRRKTTPSGHVIPGSRKRR